MKINLNQIFSTKNTPDYIRWEDLTKGRFQKPLNLYKGMPYFKEIRGIVPSLGSNFGNTYVRSICSNSTNLFSLYKISANFINNGTTYPSGYYVVKEQY